MRPLAAFLLVLLGLGRAHAQPHTTPGIAGEISAPKALKWLYGNYDAAKKRSASGTAFVEVYATQSAVVDGVRQWFLYTVSNEESNTCHACQVKLGAAAFAKQDQWWMEKSNQQEVSEIGSNGVPPIGRTTQWGKSSFGLLIDDGWIDTGVATMYQALFGFEKGGFRKIFEVQLSYNDGASLKPAPATNWEAQWSFAQPGADGVFDIAVRMKSKGSRAQGNPDPGIYRYDGKAYRNIKTQAPFGKP